MWPERCSSMFSLSYLFLFRTNEQKIEVGRRCYYYMWRHSLVTPWSFTEHHCEPMKSMENPVACRIFFRRVLRTEINLFRREHCNLPLKQLHDILLENSDEHDSKPSGGRTIGRTNPSVRNAFVPWFFNIVPDLFYFRMCFRSTDRSEDSSPRIVWMSINTPLVLCTLLPCLRRKPLISMTICVPGDPEASVEQDPIPLSHWVVNYPEGCV